MSDADVQVVRDQFQAVNDTDWGRAMDLYADDAVLVVHPSFSFETGTFEGKQAVGEWFGQWFRMFEPGFHFDIDEAREIGDAVFIHAGLSGVGRSSGVPVEDDLAYLYRVSDGKITRAEIFRTRDDALAAAGERPG